MEGQIKKKINKSTNFIAAVQTQYEKIKLIQIRTFDFKSYKKHPYQTANILKEIVDLIEEKNYENQLVLLGIFETHQRQCEDELCPCQYQMMLNEDSSLHQKLDQGSIIPIAGDPKKDLEQFKSSRKYFNREQEEVKDFKQLQIKKNSSHSDLESKRSQFQTTNRNYTLKGYQTTMFSDMINQKNKELNNINMFESSFGFASKPSSPHRPLRSSKKKKTHKIKSLYKMKQMNFQILQQDYPSFKKWILNFVDYQFEELLKYLYQSRKYSTLINMGVRFVYFEIEIQALYYVRKWTYDISQKSYYYQVVEKSISDLIENNIKDKDKALKYSIRKIDNIQAKTIENFTMYVVLDELYTCFNQKLQDLVRLKLEYYKHLVEGINTFFKFIQFNIYLYFKKDTNQWISYFVFLVNQLKNLSKYISQYQDSPSFNKLLVIFYKFIWQDMRRAQILDENLKNIKNKIDYSQGHTLPGKEIIDGNIASIIAQFRTKVGKIVKYSANAPNFFGYRKLEFDTLSNLNELIPSILAEKHDLFIERFIYEGKSKILRTFRQTLAKDRQGYIFPVKIYINYFFELQHDFIFSALVSKIQSNSQYILISPNGFIDGYSKSFFEFCQVVCPQLTNSVLQFSNIHLFFEDLDMLTRQCNQQNKLINKRVVLNLHTDFHIMISKFKNLWKNDKQNSRLMYHIMNIQEEYEDDEENYFSFDITLNISLNQNNLISGEQLNFYILEITRVVPNKKKMFPISDTKLNSFEIEQDFSSKYASSHLSIFCENYNSTKYVNIDSQSNIQTSENIKNSKIDKCQAKHCIFKREDESHDIAFQKKCSVHKLNINSLKSLKSNDDNQIISEQLEEMEQDIHQMVDEQLKSTSRITSPLISYRFLQSNQQLDQHDANDQPFSSNDLLQYNNVSIPHYTTHIISPRSVQGDHNDLIDHNHSIHMISPRSIEGENENLVNLNHSIHFIQPRRKEGDHENIVDHSILNFQSAHLETFQSYAEKNNTCAYVNNLKLEQQNLKNQKAKQCQVYDVINLKSEEKMYLSTSNGSFNFISGKNSQISSPLYIHQCVSEVKTQNCKQSDKTQQKSQDNLVKQQNQLISISTSKQIEKISLPMTQASTQNQQNKKKINRLDIINKINLLTEKNNAVNLDYTLSEEDIQSYIENYEKNKCQDNQMSTKSVGSLFNKEFPQNLTSIASDTVKKIKTIEQLNNVLSHPSFFKLIHIQTILLITALIFGLIASLQIQTQYVEELTNEMIKYNIEQSTILSISSSISQIFIIENNQKDIGFNKEILKQSYKEIDNQIKTIMQSYISEFQKVDMITVQNQKSYLSMRILFMQFHAAIYLAAQEGKYNEFTSKQLMIFQMHDKLKLFSKEVKNTADDIFNYYQNKNILIFIIEVIIQGICLLLLMKVYFSYRNYIKQYLYISTRISQKEAETEHSQLTNILQFLEQSQDQYLRYNLDKNNTSQNLKYNDKIVQTDSQNHNHLLFNRIKIKSLNFIALIILVIGVFLINFIIQIATFTITKQELAQIELPLNLYKKYTSKMSDLSVLNIAHQFTYIQNMNNDLSAQFIKTHLTQLKEFYLEKFQSLPAFYEDQDFSEELQQLNEANTCFVFQKEQINQQICSNINNSILTKGLLQGFRRMFAFYQDTPQYSDKSKHAEIFEQINMNTIILKILDKSKSFIFDSPQIMSNRQQKNKVILVDIGHISIIFIILSLGVYLCKKIKYEISLIQKSIQFIPYERLISDDSTIQLIKNLNN